MPIKSSLQNKKAREKATVDTEVVEAAKADVVKIPEADLSLVAQLASQYKIQEHMRREPR